MRPYPELSPEAYKDNFHHIEEVAEIIGQDAIIRGGLND